MRTKLDYSSLGEAKGTYSNTNSSIRQIKQKLSASPVSMPRGGSAAGIAVGLLAGAGVGVLAGILMAPNNGKTTRRRLSDSASWVGRGITEAFNNSRGKMDSWIGKAEDRMKEPGTGKNEGL